MHGVYKSKHEGKSCWRASQVPLLVSISQMNGWENLLGSAPLKVDIKSPDFKKYALQVVSCANTYQNVAQEIATAAESLSKLPMPPSALPMLNITGGLAPVINKNPTVTTCFSTANDAQAFAENVASFRNCLRQSSADSVDLYTAMTTDASFMSAKIAGYLVNNASTLLDLDGPQTDVASCFAGVVAKTLDFSGVVLETTSDAVAAVQSKLKNLKRQGVPPAGLQLSAKELDALTDVGCTEKAKKLFSSKKLTKDRALARDDIDEFEARLEKLMKFLQLELKDNKLCFNLKLRGNQSKARTLLAQIIRDLNAANDEKTSINGSGEVYATSLYADRVRAYALVRLNRVRNWVKTELPNASDKLMENRPVAIKALLDRALSKTDALNQNDEAIYMSMADLRSCVLIIINAQSKIRVFGPKASSVTENLPVVILGENEDNTYTRWYHKDKSENTVEGFKDDRIDLRKLHNARFVGGAATGKPVLSKPASRVEEDYSDGDDQALLNYTPAPAKSVRFNTNAVTIN